MLPIDRYKLFGDMRSTMCYSGRCESFDFMRAMTHMFEEWRPTAGNNHEYDLDDIMHYTAGYACRDDMLSFV